MNNEQKYPCSEKCIETTICDDSCHLFEQSEQHTVNWFEDNKKFSKWFASSGLSPFTTSYEDAYKQYESAAGSQAWPSVNTSTSEAMMNYQMKKSNEFMEVVRKHAGSQVSAEVKEEEFKERPSPLMKEILDLHGKTEQQEMKLSWEQKLDIDAEAKKYANEHSNKGSDLNTGMFMGYSAALLKLTPKEEKDLQKVTDAYTIAMKSAERRQLRIEQLENAYAGQARHIMKLTERIKELEAKEEKEEWISVRWQLCPKCEGQGQVSKPPYLAAGVNEWTSSQMAWVCDVCNGAKIITTPPAPPKQAEQNDKA